MASAGEIDEAVDRLRSGGVVILPTETVYGLAANGLLACAVEKIFRIKKRPTSDPLILHVLDNSWLPAVSNMEGCEGRVTALVKKFWPGPLTILLPKKGIVPNIVTANKSTVAVRCPKHEIFREVLRRVKFPLAAPSANPFGYVSPTRVEQVRETLGKLVDVIADGGPCEVGLESTIVDVTSSVVKILRPGAISAYDISRAIGERVDDYNAGEVVADPKCPGQLKQHYSTNTRLELFESGGMPDFATSRENTAAVIFQRKPDDTQRAKIKAEELDIYWLSEHGDLAEVAQNLFRTLQELDGKRYQTIYCEKAKNIGIGMAINDRLSRAAAKFKNNPD